MLWCHKKGNTKEERVAYMLSSPSGLILNNYMKLWAKTQHVKEHSDRLGTRKDHSPLLYYTEVLYVGILWNGLNTQFLWTCLKWHWILTVLLNCPSQHKGITPSPYCSVLFLQYISPFVLFFFVTAEWVATSEFMAHTSSIDTDLQCDNFLEKGRFLFLVSSTNMIRSL